MGFHSKLVQIIKVGVILSAIMAAAITAFPIALPNCPDSCGNVKIPSPFGTTEGCYLNDTAVDGDYFINCTSNAYGQPQQMIWNINVISISMEGEIDIQMYNSIDCYDEYGTPLSPNNTAIPSLWVPGFTVSATKNKFVAVGCDTYAILNGYDLNGQPSQVGCQSTCNNTLTAVSGACSGIGCCQMDIPQDLTNIQFKASSISNHTKVWNFNPCSFAFIIQEDKFNFSSDYLIGLRSNETLPMALDWGDW